jgi:hypothetical protein
MKPHAPIHRIKGAAGVQKTYSHLAGERRVPSEYELVSTALLYYTKRGFELNVPVKDWYERHQRDTALRCSDWDRFRDPRETTYTKYTALKRDQEVFVDGILQSIEDSDHDARLPAAWLTVLLDLISPARYLFHGLQMLAAYLGQMAPGGRVVMAALFQSADELRRVHRFAYRMRQLQNTHANFGADGKQRWQTDPRWQPCREAIERLLVTYDLGEALVGVNLAVKPLIDLLLMEQLAQWAGEQGDPLLRELLHSLAADCDWQRSYTAALCKVLLSEPSGAENRAAIAGWLGKWLPFAERAVAGLAELAKDHGASLAAAAAAKHRAFLAQCGLDSLAKEGGP